MRDETRLQLKPFQPTAEHVDGAWWPRSSRLVDELPGLLVAVSERIGPIAVVGYHHGAWDDTPPQLDIAGYTVELLGFTGDEPAGVILIGRDGHHLTLHVIPFDAGEAHACQALDEVRHGTDGAASDAARSLVARSIADVAEKLAQHEGGGDDRQTAQLRPRVSQWCAEAAERFADAPVQTFVPVLVEHIVRERIRQARPASASRLAAPERRTPSK